MAEFELPELGVEQQVVNAGGHERKLRVWRLPDTRHTAHLNVSIPVQQNRDGDAPEWTRVTTGDGFNARSSSIYLDHR